MTTVGTSVALPRDTGRWRPAVLAAGPLGVLALVAFVAAIVVDGDDELVLATSELAIASSVAGLASLVLLIIGLFGVAIRVSSVRRGAGLVGWSIACVGTVLTAGGQWALLFVLPGLAGSAPDLAANGIGSVQAGYVVSFLVMAVGWLIVGITLLRADAPRLASWLVLVGAVFCVAPLPSRFFLLAVAVSLLARSWSTPAGDSTR